MFSFDKLQTGKSNQIIFFHSQTYNVSNMGKQFQTYMANTVEGHLYNLQFQSVRMSADNVSLRPQRLLSMTTEDVDGLLSLLQRA